MEQVQVQAKGTNGNERAGPWQPVVLIGEAGQGRGSFEARPWRLLSTRSETLIFFFFFNSYGQNLWGDVNQQLQPSGHSEVAHSLGKVTQFEGGS